MITFCLVAFICTFSNATCQFQTLARGHQLVARITLLVAHAFALVGVEFQWSGAVTLAHTATSLYVEVELLVRTSVALLVASAFTRVRVIFLLIGAARYMFTFALAGIGVEFLSA